MLGLKKTLTILIAIWALANSNTFSQTSEPQQSPPCQQNTYLDSQLMLKKLSASLEELHEKEGEARTKELNKQLARNRCNVPLSIATKSTVTPPDLYEQQKESVLVVGSLYKCGKCTKWHTRTASGFLVSSDGVMITNYHVVDHPDDGALGVLTHDGTFYAVKEVLAADRNNDIAVLQLDGSGFPYISLFPQSPVGSKIWVISNPNKQLYTYTEGIVSAHLQQTKHGVKVKRIAVTADFGGGSSGAPIFDEHGRVIAMVASTRPVKNTQDSDTNYAQMVFKHCIPAESILKLFTEEKTANIK